MIRDTIFALLGEALDKEHRRVAELENRLTAQGKELQDLEWSLVEALRTNHQLHKQWVNQTDTIRKYQQAERERFLRFCARA